MNIATSDPARDLSDTLRHAEKHPSRNDPERKNAYKILLERAHTDTSHKKLATEHIKDYFVDFPELQDDAINTIYDLCEDQDPQVRIAGYEAITSVSKADKNWLVRNADVLVQLLQSDEETEVEVVKKALLEHIDMDPPRALQVLCDQCIFDSGILDEEERAMRGRLRTLVIQFLARDAKRRVARQPNEKAEEILFTGLVNAIPKSTDDEVTIIVKEILLLMPSLKTRGRNGNTLLKTLLDSANQTFKDDLRSGSDISSLSNIRVYLQLARLLAVEKGAADPLLLLRFYLASRLISKIMFQQLTDTTQTMVIAEIADAWSACDAILQRNEASNRDHIILARNQLVEACPILLEAVTKSGLPDKRSCDSCHTLLNACHSRKLNFNWVVPSHITTAVREVQAVATKQMNGSNAEVIQSALSLCRSLLEPVSKLPISRQSSNYEKAPGNVASSSTDGSAPPTHNAGKRRYEERRVSPSRRPGSVMHQAESSMKPIALPKNQDIVSIKDADNDDDQSPRSQKRAKKWASDARPPSLLSRMETGSNGSAPRGPNGPMPRPRFDLPPRPFSGMQRQSLSESGNDGPLRIKGAALGNGQNVLPTSLLDRMGDSTRAPSQGGDWGNGEQRRRFNDR